MSIFSRKQRLGKLAIVRHFVWPHTGWRRALKYSAYRVQRIDGSPSGVAIGVAWGVAVSFTPFYFLHIGIAVAGSWLMGGSLLAAAIGTLFLNPLTFPIISWVTYNLGNYFLPRSIDLQVGKVPSMSYIFDNFSEVLAPYFLPMILGGFVLGVISWFIVFIIVRELISRYRESRGRIRNKNIIND
ncbi:MAG: hypothetical protein CMM32_03850 [Rhodospirillaceae bacterium]|nr:hypothetical protein [Rhodospirillaceae bacterium]|tara:strand:- start:6763 stop:7317 length:555 start_codon:yes stop_codon:yes gene_type:complete